MFTIKKRMIKNMPKKSAEFKKIVDNIEHIFTDTAHEEISNRLQKEKKLSKEEADEQAGKILSASTKKNKIQRKFQTLGKFQMKNKEFRFNEVFEAVANILEKKNENDIQKRAEKKYNEQYNKINPSFAKIYGGVEKVLESQGITREGILEKEYAEEIQDAFNNIINRRVKVERAIGIHSFKQLTEEILLRNLNAIRGVRKHEVGMKWQQRRSF